MNPARAVLCSSLLGDTGLEPRSCPDEAGSGGAGGVFGVIYADPPWRYDWAMPNKGVDVENHYPTMSEEEICALQVPAARRCVLYLWATAPKLSQAMAVIRAWGFDYKTSAVWDKLEPKMGFWFRGQHELLLVATRGTVSPPPSELRIASVIRCPRGPHSAKPDYVRDQIAKWFPDVLRLEMFSRLKRPGWEAFGNDVGYDLLSGPSGGGGGVLVGDGNATNQSGACSPSVRMSDAPLKPSDSPSASQARSTPCAGSGNPELEPRSCSDQAGSGRSGRSS